MKLDSTFRHRSFWLGITMIVIMFYHSGMNINSRLYSFVLQYGYAGVDVFLFASGIGCYYSLDKDPDILRFLKRRVQRLGPTYLCFLIPWFIWRAFYNPMPLGAMIGNLLGIESFVSWNYHLNWYLSALVPFYILLPYMKQITDRFSSLWGDLLMLCLLFAVCVPAWDVQVWNMIIWSRLPIVYMGVIYGKLGKRGTLLTKKFILLNLVCMMTGCFLLRILRGAPFEFLWYKGFHWYPFLFIVPSICLCLSGIGEFLLRSKLLKPLYLLLQKIGTYSFELYLVHLFLFEQLMPELRSAYPTVPVNTLWLIVWCAIVPLCFLLNRTTACFTLLTKKLTPSR